MVYTQSDRYAPDVKLIDFLSSKFGSERLVVVNIFDQRLRNILCDRIKSQLPESSYVVQSMLSGIISSDDDVVMVTPIDSSAPEGRMILPQVQLLRDILDNNAHAHITQPDQLSTLLDGLKTPPSLVVTDSQAFSKVSEIVPTSVPLTSFSILLARTKGLFEEYLAGTPTISNLRDGDRVLLLESCTHNVTCEDIGRVKIPALLRTMWRMCNHPSAAGLPSHASHQCGNPRIQLRVDSRLSQRNFPASHRNIQDINR